MASSPQNPSFLKTGVLLGLWWSSSVGSNVLLKKVGRHPVKDEDILIVPLNGWFFSSPLKSVTRSIWGSGGGFAGDEGAAETVDS